MSRPVAPPHRPRRRQPLRDRNSPRSLPGHTPRSSSFTDGTHTPVRSGPSAIISSGMAGATTPLSASISGTRGEVTSRMRQKSRPKSNDSATGPARPSLISSHTRWVDSRPAGSLGSRPNPRPSVPSSSLRPPTTAPGRPCSPGATAPASSDPAVISSGPSAAVPSHDTSGPSPFGLASRRTSCPPTVPAGLMRSATTSLLFHPTPSCPGAGPSCASSVIGSLGVLADVPLLIGGARQRDRRSPPAGSA
jgi:hypothetical protein